MSEEALIAHLQTGCTTVCHLWRVQRADGVVMGFTDHDETIIHEGVAYRADSGLTAQALQQTTGMSVDNTEAVGALSSMAVSEEDIALGRYDKANVVAWLVNWQNLTQKLCLFRGTFGEITRRDGVFKVELRGLTEKLNQPQGRTYQKTCSAILGDRKCQVNLADPAYNHEEALIQSSGGGILFAQAGQFAEGWFVHGTLEVLTGAASGQRAVVKQDLTEGGLRRIVLWEDFALPLAAGDIVRLRAGCDRLMKTCKGKFDNLLNFRGFPHIPGDDWITSYPVSSMTNTGASRYQGGSNGT